MKTFRRITGIAIIVLVILIVANAFFMMGLYDSIKEKTLRTAQECLQRADFMEMIVRLRKLNYMNDSVITLHNFDIVGVNDLKGGYYFRDIPGQISASLSEGMRDGFKERGDDVADLDVLSSMFKLEMAEVGLYPEKISSHLGDSITDKSLWHCTLKYPEDKHAVYTVEFSPMIAHVLLQMSGIISTSVAIMLVAGFLIIYLIHKIRRMRTIDEMKDDFTHNMTHELKAPLSAAISAADLLQNYYDPKDEERNRHLLDIIMKRLDMLTDMVNKILTVSTTRYRSIRLNVKNVDVRPIIDNVIETITVKNLKPTEFKVNIRPEKLSIMTDEHHFTNILTNLVENAVKYSDQEVTIQIDIDKTHLSVKDNGIGISNKALPYIFDKFFRESTGDRYTVGGYGLGLYYVNQVVKELGWTISVTSQKGTGTTFDIKFN